MHLKKLCVGVSSMEELAIYQDWKRRIDPDSPWHDTRATPTRAEEILAHDGSLYWIMKGYFAARQRIRAIDTRLDFPADDPLSVGAMTKPRRMCRLWLDPELIRVEDVAHRPFQGWRYLPADECPADVEIID